MKYLVEKKEDEYIVKYKTDAKHLPRGGSFLFVDGVDAIHPVLKENEDGSLEIVENEILIQEADLYRAMVSEVYSEMKAVFGTDNDVSAAAFASTWEAMKQRPENYIDEELGLIDAETVTAYANEKINLADAYAVKRLKIIEKFRADKLALKS